MTNAEFIPVAVNLWLQSERAQVRETPDALLAAVSGAKARDIDDLAHKLALWRLSQTHLVTLNRTTSLTDRLLYSIYRDAILLSGRTELSTDNDAANDFYADVLTDARAA